jgi:hypothetical protein
MKKVQANFTVNQKELEFLQFVQKFWDVYQHDELDGNDEEEFYSHTLKTSDEETQEILDSLDEKGLIIIPFMENVHVKNTIIGTIMANDNLLNYSHTFNFMNDEIEVMEDFTNFNVDVKNEEEKDVKFNEKTMKTLLENNMLMQGINEEIFVPTTLAIKLFSK